jgi:hypothetical protein
MSDTTEVKQEIPIPKLEKNLIEEQEYFQKRVNDIQTLLIYFKGRTVGTIPNEEIVRLIKEYC